MAKNQAKAKQHPQAKISLFENFSLSASTLSSKNHKAWHILQYLQINKCAYFNEIIILSITMKVKMKMKNGSHRYDKNRPGPKQGH